MKVLVIGAGIAGLGVATYFSGKGHTVTVIEAMDRVGGRARTVTTGNALDIADAGTQYIHSSYRLALRLIRDVGLQKCLSRISGFTEVFGSSISDRHFLLHHRFPWYRSAGIRGNLRLGSYILQSVINQTFDTFGMANRPSMDGVTGIRNGLNPLVLNSIIRPLALAGTLAEPNADNISQHHCNRLIRIILFTDYLSLAGGIASLHEALAARLNIRLETPVSGLLVENGRVAGVALAAGRNLQADHVVIATPPAVAAGMLPVEWRLEREFLGSIRMPAFILPTFFLDRALNHGVWSYLTHNLSGIKIKYLIDVQAKNSAMVKSGNSVIQPWICNPEAMILQGMDDNGIVDLCRNELDLLFPGFSSWIQEIVITRHPYGIPQHPPGHDIAARAFLDSADARGVSFCGDYLTGGYVESALWSAWRAAEKFG